VCIRVAQPAEVKAPAALLVPTPRLESADLWAAYGVTKADTFVLADRYGNPFVTTTEPLLNEKLAELSSHFRTQRKTLKKHIETAQAARDKGDMAATLAALKDGFKLGLTGYTEAKEASKLYDECIKTGREQLAAAGKDAKALEALAKTFEGTELASEIEAARKSTN
jgi:hypothetical protein